MDYSDQLMSLCFLLVTLCLWELALSYAPLRMAVGALFVRVGSLSSTPTLPSPVLHKRVYYLNLE